MKYIVFSKNTCPYCIKTIELLRERNLPFHVVNFEEAQSSVLEEVKTAYDWPTVPLILKKNEGSIEFVGGHTDLLEFLSDGKD
jgi:glutaredoxin